MDTLLPQAHKKVTANLGKLKKHMELTTAIEKVGLNTATLVKTTQNEAYVKESES